MSRQALSTQRDRAGAALLGVALGDALGMPSQTLGRDEIRRRYGTITDFVAPFEGHPVSHGLGAATVTDDTEQTLLLARRIIASPDVFDSDAWARDLLDWEAGVSARGLRDLLGPSSKRALESLSVGVSVAEAGRHGTTNGAAMRITPVAIATPAEPLSTFLDAIEEVCRATHNTAEAIAAAGAVAAVISAGIDGATFEDSLPLALAAAKEGAQRGHRRGEVDIVARIKRSLELAAGQPELDSFAEAVGTSVASHESVAAAFGVVRLAGHVAWDAALLSANIGGDTDTIGTMATAMATSCESTTSLPQRQIATLVKTNHLELGPIVSGLLAIRARRSASPVRPDKAGV